MKEQHRNFPDGFKMTELGPLPQEWEVVKLGEVSYFETGKRMKGGALKGGEIFSIGGEHITDEGNIKYEPLKFVDKDFYLRMTKGKVRIGDILICKDGAKTGKTAFVKYFPYPYCAVNEHVFVVRSKNINQLINQFLFFFLYSQYGQTQIKKVFHGLIGGITQRDLFNLLIHLPPLPEQRKIAAILSTVQKAIEIEEKLIERTKELKKAMMHKLFTEGTRGEKQKMTEIGTIPESWDVVRLGEVVNEIISGDWGEEFKVSPDYIESYVIRGTDFKSLISGNIENIPIRFIKKYSLEKRRVLKDDILIELSGGGPDQPTGRICFISSDYNKINLCFTNFVKKLKINKQKCVPLYYSLYWSYLYNKRKTLLYEKRTTGIRNFKYKEFLENEYIPLPHLEEQRKIADIISTIDQKIEFHSTKKQKLEELFRTLLHELMTAKRRVDEVDLDFLEMEKE